MMSFWETFYRVGFKCHSSNQQHKRPEKSVPSPRLLQWTKIHPSYQGDAGESFADHLPWAVSFHPGKGKRSSDHSVLSISHGLLKSTQGCSGFLSNQGHSGFRVIKFSSWGDVCCLCDSWDKKQWVGPYCEHLEIWKTKGNNLSFPLHSPLCGSGYECPPSMTLARSQRDTPLRPTLPLWFTGEKHCSPNWAYCFLEGWVLFFFFFLDLRKSNFKGLETLLGGEKNDAFHRSHF